jgi:hypothetical protein
MELRRLIRAKPYRIARVAPSPAPNDEASDIWRMSPGLSCCWQRRRRNISRAAISLLEEVPTHPDGLVLREDIAGGKLATIIGNIPTASLLFSMFCESGKKKTKASGSNLFSPLYTLRASSVIPDQLTRCASFSLARLPLQLPLDRGFGDYASVILLLASGGEKNLHMACAKQRKEAFCEWACTRKRSCAIARANSSRT